MTLEALLQSNEQPSFLVYDHHQMFSGVGDGRDYDIVRLLDGYPPLPPPPSTVGRKKKKRRRTRSCRNKEVAESQRMTHIAVERNRRRQMNEHLSVLRSLMPDSYINRKDQASIVGGAIEYVKELEQLLQSLEVRKIDVEMTEGGVSKSSDISPFAEFFRHPQFVWSHLPREVWEGEDTSTSTVGDVEVILVETHANVRVLSPKRPGQLLKLVSGMYAMRLSILHLNITTLDPLVLYSFSAKVEEGCNLTTGGDIAGALHHMLTLIEAESLLSFGG